MTRRPIDPRIDTGRTEGTPSEEGRVSRDDFRDALAHWATGVSIVAVRDESDVQATTVGSLTSISDDPPTIAVSLTASARILPFLTQDVRFGVSVLEASQARIASVFADSYPVGPSPFGDDEIPLVENAVVGLACRVTQITAVSGSYLVIGMVEHVTHGPERDPLVYYRRQYQGLDTLE